MKDRYLVLEANAGSGKTFNLVSRYLNLLFLEVPPEKIFALTFTKKATKEMFDRILYSLSNPKISGEILEIATNMNFSDDEVESKSESYYKILINSDIKIMTLDSLENLILKKFSHHLNIIPNYKIVNNINIEEFNSLFLENISKTSYKNVILTMESLDDKLKIKAILNELENLYKKEIIFYKLQEEYLHTKLEDNLSELEVFILEIKDKIKEWLLQPKHKLSKSANKSLDINNIDELMDKGKSWLFKDKLAEFSFFKKAFKKTSSESENIEIEFIKLKHTLDKYWNLKRDMILQNLFYLYQFYVKEREKFVKREKKLSFDDINHFLVQLVFNNEIDSKFIYFKLDTTIDHLLIDEFQDTSLLQYRVLEPIINDILSGGSKEDKTFFYVGDKMQSIFRFRGGFSNLFDYIQIKYPNLEKKTLPNNYRSKENIVNFVNQLFGTKQKIVNQNQLGGNIILKESKNPIDNILDEVNNLINNGIELNDIAIICSKNKDIMQISNILLSNNINIQSEINQSITEYLPVQAVTQYILYLYYIEDKNSSFYLKNFQTSIGKDPRTKCDNFLNIDISEFTLFEIGIQIFQHFQLFDGNENSLQFLENLKNDYIDITDFIYNYSNESSKIIHTENNGINILTVHKAKGLEFNNVIFVDFSKIIRGNFNNIKLVQSFKGIAIENIAWKFKNSFDLSLLNILKNEKIEQEQDIINKLYVAFTRAKNSLIILKMETNSSLDLIEINQINFSKFQ